MTEYWKSQPKKWCEFCRCWITDNKASVQFHERGDGHKAQVARRLSELTRKGEQDYRAQQHVNTELKKMEDAALKAYHKDLTSNPDLSAKSFVKDSFVSKVVEQAAANPNKVYKSGESAAIQAASSLKGNAPGPSLPLLPAPKVWHEIQTPEGYSYYWNVVTNETTWEAPEEGFLSILDQQLEELMKATEEGQSVAVEPAAAKKKKKKKKKKEGQFNQEFEHEEEQEEEEDTSGYDASNPYGQWQTVEKLVPQGPVDLQLPKIKFNQAKAPVPSALSSEPKIRFTEKTIASATPISSFVKREPGASEFKKRKVDDAKKNLRARDTDGKDE